MLLQITQNIFTTRQAADAALSQTASQQLEKFLAADRPTFQQTRDHRQIREHRRVHQRRLVEHEAIQMQRELFPDRSRPVQREGLVHRCRLRNLPAGGGGDDSANWLNGRGRRGVMARGLRGLEACRRVELFLIRSPLVRLIVLPAPRVAALATMVLSTTKRAAEILSTSIPRMREETNPAMATGNRTVFQIGTITQDGIERELILTNKRKSAIVLMPVLAKRENFGDGYDKNAKFSVKMLIVLSISSSYELDAKASRCRARIFLRLGPTQLSLTDTIDQHATNRRPAQPILPTRHQPKRLPTWKTSKSPTATRPFLFPSSRLS